MGEYGTGRGIPARRGDGSSKELRNNETAMVERIKAIRDVPSFEEPRLEEVFEMNAEGNMVPVVRPFAPDVNAIAEVDERTNRYGRETRSEQG